MNKEAAQRQIEALKAEEIKIRELDRRQREMNKRRINDIRQKRLYISRWVVPA